MPDKEELTILREITAESFAMVWKDYLARGLLIDELKHEAQLANLQEYQYQREIMDLKHNQRRTFKQWLNALYLKDV